MTGFILIVIGQTAARVEMSLLEAGDMNTLSAMFDRDCPLEKTLPIDEALYRTFEARL